MLKYELFEENEKQILYRYYPEGNSDFGVISVTKDTKEYNVVNLAKTDKHYRYALKMFTKIRKFIEDDSFEKSGTMAWY